MPSSTEPNECLARRSVQFQVPVPFWLLTKALVHWSRYHCEHHNPCYSHFKGYTPLGAPADNWFPFYSNGSRTPLLGDIFSPIGLTGEDSVAADIKSADTALDFFDVLYYDGGADCGLAPGADPNLRYCLDTTLAWMLNSTSVWEGVKRLHFYVTYGRFWATNAPFICLRSM